MIGISCSSGSRDVALDSFRTPGISPVDSAIIEEVTSSVERAWRQLPHPQRSSLADAYPHLFKLPLPERDAAEYVATLPQSVAALRSQLRNDLPSLPWENILAVMCQNPD